MTKELYEELEKSYRKQRILLKIQIATTIGSLLCTMAVIICQIVA